MGTHQELLEKNMLYKNLVLYKIKITVAQYGTKGHGQRMKLLL
jgi:hypothetical protein